MSSPDDKIDKKIDVILAAVQNFGLNFIQKIGELKHSIGVLTDQMEKMNEALITIKGFEPKINEIATMKKEIVTEMHLMQSMIKATNLKNADIIKMKSDTDTTDHITVLASFKEMIRDYSKISNLTKDLEEAKKKIYEITGGHRVLYEMGEMINQYNQKESLSEPDIQILEDKVTFWLNKLKN